jgi:hypothetical protein
MRLPLLLLVLVTLAAAAASAGSLADSDAAGAQCSAAVLPPTSVAPPTLAQPSTTGSDNRLHTFAAVMRALRSAMLGLAEVQRNPDAVLAAAAAHPHCCDADGLADAHFLCFAPPDIGCPIQGWVTNQTAHHCTWAGASCNPRGQITSL